MCHNCSTNQHWFFPSHSHVIAVFKKGRQGLEPSEGVKSVGSESLPFPTCVCGEGGACIYLFFLISYFTFQDLELENQDLKDRMREVQEEQRMLLDRISGLQLQLSEVNQDLEYLAANLAQPPGAHREQHGIGMWCSLLSWELLQCVSLVFCWKSLWCCSSTPVVRRLMHCPSLTPRNLSKLRKLRLCLPGQLSHGLLWVLEFGNWTSPLNVGDVWHHLSSAGFPALTASGSTEKKSLQLARKQSQRFSTEVSHTNLKRWL